MVELLRTKLYIPRIRSNLVSRPRLIERLNTGLDKKLTLIAAPAGFGKTTLLSEWIPQCTRKVVWLSLDENDNDPARFWVYFIISLQQLRQNLGSDALGLLQSPQALPITSVLTSIINETAAVSEEFAVVLDDYHVIDFQPIHDALAFMIDHLPANMHLVLSTRADPPLPLGRMRIRDNLNEFRVNDLRFHSDEVSAFLNQVMGLDLSVEEVAALEARTEGWIAGLQIAALSMQGRDDIQGFIKGFSGSHRHILGYLAEEVLNHQTEDTLNFLLQTSILDRLCGEFCDAVTKRTNSQSILEKLEHTNLFVIPLDDEQHWYRYHHLFAEVLRQKIHHLHPELVVELHRRARDWLEEFGLMEEAVGHAIKGQDYPLAAHLIEKLLSEMWQTGEIKTIQAWLAAVPIVYWRAYPRLWLVKAWVAMTVGDLVEGDANIKAAEEALNFVDEETTRYLRPEVLAFRASYSSLAQEPRSVELTQQALRELPADYWMRGMLIVFLGAAYYSVGDLDAALRALDQAPRTAKTDPGAQPHRIHLLAFRGTLLFAKGKLREALSFLNRAIALAEPGGKPIPFVGTLLAYISLAPVLYELGQLDEAWELTTRCLELAINFGSPEVQVNNLSLLAQICLARDNLPGAMAYFDQVDRLLQEHIFSISIMAHVNFRRYQMHMKQGKLTQAGAWIDTFTDPPGALNPYAFHRIALPKLMIANSNFGSALEKLSAFVTEAQETGHGNLLLKALILQSLALAGRGDFTEALGALKNTISLAEPEGYISPFVEEGEPMRHLLLDFQAAIKKKISDRSDVESLRLLVYTDRLLSAFPQPAQAKSYPERVAEPLSERELAILRLISTGRSNQEIAEILVIAVSTVKSHINNLYGKLGTNRRTQAIAIANELGLLSE